MRFHLRPLILKTIKSIEELCANSKTGIVTVERFDTLEEAEKFMLGNEHLLTPKVVSVEVAPNDIRFQDVLFKPIFYAKKYDGRYSVYASA